MTDDGLNNWNSIKLSLERVEIIIIKKHRLAKKENEGVFFFKKTEFPSLQQVLSERQRHGFRV